MGSVQPGLNMKFLVSLALLGLAAARNLQDVRIDSLEYGFCEGAAEPATIDTLTVEPFPLVIATGETITLQVAITLNEPVPVGSSIELKIKKEGIVDIPFPCLNIDDLHIGSCTYDGDDPLVVTLPEIPSIIGDLLASGTYYAQATVKLADGSDMTCIWVRVQLVGH